MIYLLPLAIPMLLAAGIYLAIRAIGKIKGKLGRYAVGCLLGLLMLSFLPLSLAPALFINAALQASLSHEERLHLVFPEVSAAGISGLISTNPAWTGDDLFIGFVAKADVVDDIVKRHGLKPYGNFPIEGEKPDWWSHNACSAGQNRWGAGDYKIYASGEMPDHPRGWEHIMLLYCGRDGQVLIDAREPID